MKLRLLLTFVPVCAVLALAAQNLPRGLTEEEKQIIAEGLFQSPTFIPGAFATSDPPEMPRSMAEWEEQQALVITWTGYRSILTEIVRHAKEEVIVLIVTTNETSARDYLEDRGVDLSENVEFIDAEYNTVWVRDYGGNPVYIRGVDSLAFVDWIYNRPRPKDDLVPFAVAEHMGVPIHSTSEAPFDLVNTGGNFMSDGAGRGFSSELVLMENGPQSDFGLSNHDENAVNDIMDLYMGINEYVKMPVLPYDEIHHIDMHMKLVDESTLVVGEYPEGVADGPQIEANLQYVIDQFKQETGREYKVVRIPMPPDQFGRFPGHPFSDTSGYYRTYANAMFVNQTILVPTYQEKYDTTALRIWQETLPGYKVIGIDCNDIIPASGALHCITKEIGAHQPLWIWHAQPGFITQDEPAILEARIEHVTGIDKAYLFFRESGQQSYDSLLMNKISESGWYEAALPHYGENTQLEYYFRAFAQSGKTMTRPMTAPEGFFRLSLEGSTTGLSGHANNLSGSLTVFPNPASALTCVELMSPTKTEGRLIFTDLHGKVVKTVFEGTFSEGVSRSFFDASSLPKGIYIVTVYSSDYQSSEKLVIK